jgi:hypothetical protein
LCIIPGREALNDRLLVKHLKLERRNVILTVIKEFVTVDIAS